MARKFAESFDGSRRFRRNKSMDDGFDGFGGGYFQRSGGIIQGLPIHLNLDSDHLAKRCSNSCEFKSRMVLICVVCHV